jgi:hypothetical protein
LGRPEVFRAQAFYENAACQSVREEQLLEP